jgi:hypothetical protein
MGEGLIWHTRKSIADEYQMAKYYDGNGENSGLNGRWGD